jgi:DNA-binding response OmpR family regulator
VDDLHKKILIVEDEEPLSNILKDRLANEGFNVIVAANGEEGLAMALSEKPDLILLDILLPKKGGLSMLKELRTHEDAANMPVIMLTNLSDASSINEALELGANDFLVKADTNMSSVVDIIRTKLRI